MEIGNYFSGSRPIERNAVLIEKVNDNTTISFFNQLYKQLGLGFKLYTSFYKDEKTIVELDMKVYKRNEIYSNQTTMDTTIGIFVHKKNNPFPMIDPKKDEYVTFGFITHINHIEVTPVSMFLVPNDRKDVRVRFSFSDIAYMINDPYLNTYNNIKDLLVDLFFFDRKKNVYQACLAYTDKYLDLERIDRNEFNSK